MSISPSLIQSQSQSLRMTNAMSVSLKIMQMSSIELSAFVNNELQENPIISEEEPENQNFDLSLNNVKIKNSDYDFNIDDIASEISLYEKVIEQIALSKLDTKQRLIAHYLTEHLNSNGYLEFNIIEASKILKCNIRDIEIIITHLQDFEPTGIFARTLKECLALQMKEKSLLNRKSEAILNNLELVAKNEISKLAKIAATTSSEVIDIIKDIKLLNPKPCAYFRNDKAYTKIPDVVIAPTNDGEFTISFESSNMKKIILNKDLYNKIKIKLKDKEEKKYITEQYGRASNLLKAIEKRRESTLKTAIAIFEKQRSFFENGIMELKPMTLSEIASTIHMHESSISRITTGKYIGTPFGTFEMKDFFTSKVINNHGIEISSAKIKEMIKAIISCESRNQIYSDDEISSELKKYHLSAARRTITKYREELKIPSSATRKRKARIQDIVI